MPHASPVAHWWHRPISHSHRAETHLARLLSTAGIHLNGNSPWDIHVHNPDFYPRLLAGGSLALGESYMDAWWDCGALDQFFTRLFRARLHTLAHRLIPLGDSLPLILSSLWNRQSPHLAPRVAHQHYDLGNDLFLAMLDARMQYSCAYWTDAATLDDAQLHKLQLIARKLRLAPGMRVLELGSGFGGLAHFLASEHQCEVVSYNISEQQVSFSRELCRDLPVRFELADYRLALHEPGPFDRIVSVGFLEHVGYRNYRAFAELIAAQLAPRGLCLLQTIGANQSETHTDPWLDRYIFPNGMLPSLAQLARAAEGLLVLEDLHNLGPHYDRTLMAWHRNFTRAWPTLQFNYNDRFFRMWTYYLLSSAAAFRARTQQLWQLVLSHGDLPGYARLS